MPIYITIVKCTTILLEINKYFFVSTCSKNGSFIYFIKISNSITKMEYSDPFLPSNTLRLGIFFMILTLYTSRKALIRFLQNNLYKLYKITFIKYEK